MDTSGIKHVKCSELLSKNRKVGDFKIRKKVIGAGNFGEVRVGENLQTGEKVAIKIERTDHSKGPRKVTMYMTKNGSPVFLKFASLPLTFFKELNKGKIFHSKNARRRNCKISLLLQAYI